ncbi:MAG: GNAT family N-acetyltransferase [Xenococcaceae cyanobacterium]
MSLLETERLVLKPILKSDRDNLHAILTNFYVRKYMCDDQIFSWQQIEEMAIESQKLFAEKKFGLWFIETKSDLMKGVLRIRKIIGFVGLWYFFEEIQPQLVYALLPQATCKGYATEAANKILEYSFNELGFTYLLASCDRPNIESQKLAERIGMKKIEERIVNDNPIVFFRVERQ